MSELPIGWTLKKFGDLFVIKSGFGFKYSEYVESGIPLVKIDNVSHGFIKWDNTSYLPNNYVEKYPELLLRKGDLLLALNRPITKGKLKLAKLRDEDVPSILYQRVGRIDFKSKDLSKEFYLYLLDKVVYKFVSQKSIGSDQPFISTTELKEVNVAKPPLPEQRKIAEILSTWDKAIATTEKQITNSKQQKKALMQQLLTGKKRMPGFSGDWQEVKLNTVAKISIGLVTTMTKHYVESGIPLIRNSDIKPNEIKKDKMIFLSDSFATENEHRKLKLKDIVTVHTGDVGVSAVIDKSMVGSLGFATLNTRPVLEKIYPEYLCWFFNSHNFIHWCISISTGDGRQNLNLKDFVKARIPLPPLKEQQKIAQVLTTADNEISTLETQLTHLQQEKKALMQQLLTGKRRVLVKES